VRSADQRFELRVVREMLGKSGFTGESRVVRERRLKPVGVDEQDRIIPEVA